MTAAVVPCNIGAFPPANNVMSPDHLLALLLIVAVCVIAVFCAGYFSGRMNGYQRGFDKAKKLSGQVQHLQGMSDGYVMALQHTPAQRNEYMNNVLVKTGVLTPADIEAERQRRFRMQMEG